MATRLLAAAIATMAVVVLASCIDAAAWYPSSTAAVAGSYEHDDPDGRSLIVTATVENTGTSTISRSTFTIPATTDARTYWKTVTSEARVLPGARIKLALTVSCPLLFQAIVDRTASLPLIQF